MADMTNKDEQGFDAALDSYFGFFDEEEEEEAKKTEKSGEKSDGEQAEEKTESSDEIRETSGSGGKTDGSGQKKARKEEKKPEKEDKSAEKGKGAGKETGSKTGKEAGKETGSKTGEKTGEKTGKEAGKDGKSTGKGKDLASKVLSSAETAYSLAQTKDEDTDTAREDQAEVGEGIAKEAASEHKDVTKKIIANLTDAVKEETAEAGEGAEEAAEHAGKETAAVSGEKDLSPDEGMEHELSLDTPDIDEGEPDTVQVDGTDVRLEDSSDLFSQPEAQQDYDRRSRIYGQETGNAYGTEPAADTSVTGASGIAQGGAEEGPYATAADTLLAGQGQTDMPPAGQTDTVQVDGMNVRLEDSSALFSQPEARSHAGSAVYGQETQLESGTGGAFTGPAAETQGSVTGASGISYGPATADHSTASAEALVSAQGSLAGGVLDGEEREISRTYHGHEASRHLYVNGVNLETGEAIHARGEGITSDVPVRILAGKKAGQAHVPGADNGQTHASDLVNLNGTDVRLEENPVFFTKQGSQAGAGERSRLFGQEQPYQTGLDAGNPFVSGSGAQESAAGRVTGASGIAYGPQTEEHSSASADTLLVSQGQTGGISPKDAQAESGQETKHVFQSSTEAGNGMVRMPGGMHLSGASGQALPSGYVRVNGEPVRLEDAGSSVFRTDDVPEASRTSLAGEDLSYNAGTFAGQTEPAHAAGRVTGASGITYEQAAENLSAGSTGVLLNAQGQADGTALPGSGQRVSGGRQAVSGVGTPASANGQTVSGYGQTESSGHVRVNGRDARMKPGAAMDGRQVTGAGAGRSSLNGQTVYGLDAPYGAFPVPGRPVSGRAAGRVTGASGITYEQASENLSAGSAGVLLNAQGQTDGTALPGSGSGSASAGTQRSVSANGQAAAGTGRASVGAGSVSGRSAAETGKINGKAVADEGRVNGKAVSAVAKAGKTAGNKAVQGAQKTFGGMAGIIGATVSLGQTAHHRDRDRSGNESMPSLPGGGSSDTDSLITSGTSGSSSGMAGVSSVPGRTNGKAAWKGAVNGKEAVSGRDAVSSVTGHGITGNGSLAGIGEQGLAGAGSFSYNRATGRVRTYRADKLAGDAIARSRSVSGRGIANAGEQVSGGRTATGKAGGTLGAKAGKTAVSGGPAGRGASGSGSSAGIVAGKKRSRAKIRSAEIHVSQTKHGLSQAVETEGIAGKKLAGQKMSATSLYLEQQRLKESPLLFTRDGQRTGHAARMEERLAGKAGTRSKTGSAMLRKRLADTKKKRMAKLHVGKGRPIGRKRGPLSVSAEKQKEAERRLLKFQQANSTPAGSLLGTSGGAGGAAGAAIVKRRMRAVAMKAAKKVLTASLISGIGLGVVVGGGAAAGKSSSSTFGTWYPLQANLTVGNTDGGTTDTATDTTTAAGTSTGTSYTQDAVTKMAARLAAYQSAAAGITPSGGDEVKNLKEIKVSKKTVDGKEKPVGNLKLSDLMNASVVFQYIDKNGNIIADSSGSGTGSSFGSAADVSATGTAGAILAAAKSRVGGRYVWGQGVWGTGPSDCAMDCSHYVWQVLVHAIGYQGGYTTSTNWASRGKPVASLAQAQAGDIVVYSGHVAIYDGNGYIYEAEGAAYGIVHNRRADHASIIAIRRFIPDGATVTVNGSASSTSASSASTGVVNTATTTTTTTATTGKTITLPAGLGRYFTYERWQGVGAGGDAQQRLKEQAGMTFDAEGFGKINGRYVIACTTTFGSVGDLIDFYQSDGTVFHCIMGDAKSQADAGANQWGHQNGTNVIEFIVDQNTWYSHAGGHWAGNHGNPGEGSFHREWANKFITKAVNLGSYFNGATGAGGVSGGTGSSGTSGSVMLMKEVLSMSAIGGYYKDPSDLKEYEQYCYDVIDYAVAKANGATVAYTTGSDTPTVTVRICCDMAKLEKNDKNFTDWDKKYDDGDQIPASYMALSDTDFNTIFNVSMSAFAGMSGGNSGGGQLTNAALAIYQYLAAKGVDDIHIAALLGNMAQESGGQKIESINPAAIQYPSTVGADGVPAKGGIGIIQWTGGRKNALVSFARSRGTNWTDVNTQMEFLWQEAHGSDSSAWNHFMAARTLEEATTTYCMYAEAGGPSTYNRYSATTFWVIQVRIAQAQHAYQLMQSGTLSANAGANTGTQGGTT